MIAALRSEWVKLRTVTSTVVLFIVVVAASLGFGLLATATIPLDDEEIGVSDRLSLAISGFSLSHILLAVIGVLLVTQEFRFSTIRVSFTAVPRRPRLIVAKAVVLASTAFVVSVAMVAASTVLGAAVLSLRDAPIDFGLPGTSRVLVGAVLLGVLYTLVGLAVGCIVRSQALAIVLLILWPLIVEGIFGSIFPSFGKWLPFAASGQLLVIEEDPEFLAPWIGGAYLTVVTLALLVLGTALVQRRDA